MNVKLKVKKMGILTKLFGQKTKPKKDESDYFEIWGMINKVETLEDCMVAAQRIDELEGSFNVYKLRNSLCDKTFDIYIKQYKR